jgi:hypothetical protein
MEEDGTREENQYQMRLGTLLFDLEGGGGWHGGCDGRRLLRFGRRERATNWTARTAARAAGEGLRQAGEDGG